MFRRVTRDCSGKLTHRGLLAVVVAAPLALGLALMLRPTQSPAERLDDQQVALAAPSQDLEEVGANDTYSLPNSLDGSALEAETKSAALALAVEVQPGDTLMALLTRQGVDQNQAYAAITAMETVFSAKGLKPGQALRLTFAEGEESMSAAGEESAAPTLVALQLQPNAEEEVSVELKNGGYQAETVAIPLTVNLEGHRGTITNSLFEDGVAAGVPVPVLIEMIKALSFDVDFQREIQPGDSFEVLYEARYDAVGNLATTGRILYIGMTLSGKDLDLYRYTPESGVEDFFDGKGQSVRKALMRTPIDGARLSSGFGMRKHPILGYNKMHKGVDFAAPTGTPIYAAGAGTIEYADWNKGYGKYVRIKHNGTYSTAYAHMSKIAKGISPGARVNQGDIIGYVGTTGQSTGPHLHYEVLVDGTQVNPLDIKMPSGEKLEGADLEAYQRVREEIDLLRKEKVVDAPLVASDG